MPNHYEVAHAWAHQTVRQRKGFNVFYEGATIYSYGYHFPIARITEDARGNPCVLFTSRGYSVSTSKHKSIVSSACCHMARYYVEDPRRAPNREDWERYLVEAQESAAKAKRARKYGDIHIASAASALERANALNEAFALGLPSVSLDTLGVTLTDREARIVAERERQEELRRQREAERFAREAEARESWLEGSPHAIWHGRAPSGSALLRVMGDDLETSLGVRVPLAHAIRVFQFVAERRAKGEGWRPNGHAMRVGAFQVDRIDPNGDFWAGCHFIEWSESERIARQLGISAPSDSTKSH